MRFTIDRRKWRFGGSGTDETEQPTCPRVQQFGVTRLRNAQGLLCCLGMTLEQCGIPPDKLLNVAEPWELGTEWSPERADNLGIFFQRDPRQRRSEFANTNLSEQAMTINDEPMPHGQRERRLMQLFAEEGHELRFVGEYLVGA